MIDGRVEYEVGEGSPPSPAHGNAGQTSRLFRPRPIRSGGRLAVRCGATVTMAGPIVRDGVLLLEEGKIRDVGARVACRRLACPGCAGLRRHAGLISPRSQVGISPIGDRFVRGRGLEPGRPELEVKPCREPQILCLKPRESWITALQVTPGNMNAVGGRGVVLKTAGDVVDRMIVQGWLLDASSASAAGQAERDLPSTRMGTAALIRQTWCEPGNTCAKGKGPAKKMTLRPRRTYPLKRSSPYQKGDPGHVPLRAQRRYPDAASAGRRVRLEAIIHGRSEAHSAAGRAGEAERPRPSWRAV